MPDLVVRLGLPLMGSAEAFGFEIEEAKKLVRDQHKPNCPIVIPLTAGDQGAAADEPFAAIVALDPNEEIAAKPRLSIQVGWTGSNFWFSDGIFAAEREYPLIYSTVEHPELCEALRKDRKEWWDLLTFDRSREKPYLHVKNLQQGDIYLSLSEDQFGAAECLHGLIRWNEWEERSTDWRSRVLEIRETLQKENQTEIDLHRNRFEKLCKEIGLRKGSRIDRDQAFVSLNNCLRVAMKVWKTHLDWDQIPIARF